MLVLESIASFGTPFTSNEASATPRSGQQDINQSNAELIIEATFVMPIFFSTSVRRILNH